jgi:phage tail sheath protein FI
MAGAPSESEYATVITSLLSIASSRKDCLVLFSPKKSDVVDKFGTEQTSISSSVSSITDSNYGVMDCNWKYQYDRYNDRYVWTPLNGDIAGLCVYTDLVRDPWFSPAGINRGVIKNVVKLAWNPTQAERDLLYKASINPVVSFAGEGTILYGDKTYTKKPTALNRINVRRLFIVLEKAIARAARSTLFEFNDEFTRAAFVNLVEPYLRDVQGRRGIYEYRVVCDTTNNTPEVIDRNEFVGDIYIKPSRSVNFIQLNFVAVRSGVAFEEIVGRF